MRSLRPPNFRPAISASTPLCSGNPATLPSVSFASATARRQTLAPVRRGVETAQRASRWEVGVLFLFPRAACLDSRRPACAECIFFAA